MKRHFQDIAIGEVHELGPRPLTEADSLRFSGEFDRMPFHLDHNSAEASMFGRLIASGLHTLSLTASIVVDGFISHTSMTGASGMSAVRWHRPVTLPNALSVKVTVVDTSPPKEGKNFGVVTCALETYAADQSLVMTATVNYLLACRS